MNISIREEIEKEAFRICSDALLKKGDKIVFFTLTYSDKSGGWMLPSLIPTIYYSNSATISFLEQHNLITRLGNKNNSSDITVMFNWDETDKWMKNILGEEEQDSFENKSSAHCKIKGEVGFIVFEKPKKEKIRIGKATSKQFRLLEKLEPFGHLYSVDSVFEAISNSRGEIDYDLNDPQKKVVKQKAALDDVISELQRESKLKGRISFFYTKDKRQVRLILKH